MDLFEICGSGDLEQLKRLLSNDKGDLDINIQCDKGLTPFFMACYKGHSNIVKYLMEKDNVDINKQTFNNDTAICWAAFKNNLNIVKLLIEQDKHKLNINVRNKQGLNVVDFALASKNYDIVKYLLNQKKYHINLIRGNKVDTLWNISESEYDDNIKVMLIDYINFMELRKFYENV